MKPSPHQEKILRAMFKSLGGIMVAIKGHKVTIRFVSSGSHLRISIATVRAMAGKNLICQCSSVRKLVRGDDRFTIYDNYQLSEHEYRRRLRLLM